jgi:hypothetical protein
MSLFVTQKRLNTQKRFTEMYYRQIFFEKRLFNGIEWLAACSGVKRPGVRSKPAGLPEQSRPP